MKKKILAILLCICTLLPLLPVISFAEGVELTFHRYFSGNESDWEEYNGTTSLILEVRGDQVKRLAATLASQTLGWYLKTNGEEYHVDPESYLLTDNDTRMILRFPTFEKGFCPVMNPIRQNGEDAGIYYDIDIEARDKDGNVEYYGRAEGLHSDITDPTIPGVGILNGSREDNGFRNTDSATELLFTIKEGIVSQLYKDREKYTWRFTASDGEKFYSFEAQPTSCTASSYLLTFEPCLAEPPFIPKKDTKYFINLEMYENGKLTYFAGGTIYGYTLVNEVPMVPGKKYDVTFHVGTQSQTKSYYEGQIPKCDLDTAIPSTVSHDYVFKGWNPVLTKVTGPVTYTAQYDKVLRKYDITFVTENETVTKAVPYGEMPTYDGDLSPVKKANGKVKIFTGWDTAFDKVKGEKTYRAQYRETTIDEVPVLSTESCHLYRGGERELTVTMTGGKNITSFRFELAYDTSRFELVKITPCIEGVKINGSSVSFEGAISGTGNALLKIRLKAKQDGAYGQSKLAFVNPQVYAGKTALGCIAEDATLTLGNVLSGDINLDSTVNTLDADSLVSMLLNKEEGPEKLRDTNRDGVFDLRDAVRICSYAADDTNELWSAYDDEKFTVTYQASLGGEIVGSMVQTVTRKQSTEAVLAISYAKGFVFDSWSDGRSNYKRQDYGIEENVTLTAQFEQQPIVLELPDVRIVTRGQTAINSKSEYLTGMLSIEGAATEEYNLKDVALQIKGRGNYSWDALRTIKPSYRMRLVEKQSLLGMSPAERDWVLLTTYNDVTMLRNYTTWRLGQVFDNIPHSVTGHYVTLYVNDEYKGIYLLCERIEANRLGLNDQSMNYDKDYLLEHDARAAGEGVQGLDWFYYAGGQQPAVIKSQVNSKQDAQFIQKAVTQLNEAMMSGDKARIGALMDIPALVDFYIVEEFGKDRDVGFASVYFFKKAGGKFYFTSPWDFDLAWGNDTAFPTTDGLVSTSHSANQWFRVLTEQAWFKSLVRARMEAMKDKVKVIGMEIEATGLALAEAAKIDEAHYGTIGKCLMTEPYEVYSLQSYEEHCRYFLDWYSARWQWLCQYFGVK